MFIIVALKTVRDWELRKTNSIQIALHEQNKS